MKFSDSFTQIAQDIDRNDGKVAFAYCIKFGPEEGLPEGRVIEGVVLGKPDIAQYLAIINGHIKELENDLKNMSQTQGRWR